MRQLTWQWLTDLEPSLKQWCDDAKSFARYAPTNFYPHWIGGFVTLRDALRDVAQRHGLDYDAVHAVAVGALTDVYGVARAREQRKGK